MLKFLKVYFFTLIFMLLYGCSEERTVFVLSSYDDRDVCGQPQVQGAIDSLKREINNLKIEITYLDSRRISRHELEKKCDDFAEKVKSRRPSLILTTDDAAFQCAAKHFMGEEIPVVFSGINVTPEHYNKKYHFLKERKPTKNFTGVYERLFIPKQIELVEVLVGRIDKIAVLYSTDFMGEALKQQVIYELKDTDLKNRIVFYPVSTVSELDKASEEINKRKEITAYFPFVMSIKNEKFLTLRDVASIITEKIKKIDLAINKQFVELGFFGGVSVDFYQMGYRAGQMASYILKTGKTSELDVEDADKYVRIINLKRANDIKLNIFDKQISLFDELIK
ncbi:ABC transporter substrate binding protein [Thermodesulfovibrio sp. 3907-1M]|uniref:ABC transporter substrate binding protein n=1 Tax=Thermodesulfovibrio autotrophicus TaxID=3118333 RepID=A0AAU8GUY6_9BACT